MTIPEKKYANKKETALILSGGFFMIYIFRSWSGCPLYLLFFKEKNKRMPLPSGLCVPYLFHDQLPYGGFIT
ncbi:hypothetical protein HYN49_02625 [Flavobacterium pallidum]|uniref:Uncharacterized protein n=1 Tax=Flavobacterium pallidum TaxID=2172098 RepID=A0A2S1SEN7_9FLAO|nr:hypothetical protein HYN49_02625 [Flavobacterium pallidum]